MTRSVWLLAFALLPIGCQAPTDPDPPIAVSIDTWVQRVSEGQTETLKEPEAGAEAELWPGFDSLTIPLAVFDGERTFLFRHPAPPDAFSPLTEFPGAFVTQGRFPGVSANSSSEIGDVMTATVLADGETTSPKALAGVAIHESFHVYQRLHHPSWQGDEGALFTYPVSDGEVLTLRRLESRLLRSALDEAVADRSACLARAAMEARRRRFARLDPASVAYERGSELNEGLATYVQGRVSAPIEHEIPGDGLPADEVRLRFYASGWALARLLDRLTEERAVGWAEEMEAERLGSLDEALSEAVAGSSPCWLDEEVNDAIRSTAIVDAAAVEEGRRAALAEFEAMPGWRVVLETSDEPLWPAGFDPWNVTPIDSERILHGRFLKLANQTASLEGIGYPALTVASGSHPLFSGVRRVVFSGFDERPEIDQRGDSVSIRATDFEVSVEGGTLELTDSEVIVRLGSGSVDDPSG